MYPTLNIWFQSGLEHIDWFPNKVQSNLAIDSRSYIE